MWRLDPPPRLEKSHPLFPSNPATKVEVLSNPHFLKIWLEAQPPSRKGGGGVHSMGGKPLTIFAKSFDRVPNSIFNLIQKLLAKNLCKSSGMIHEVRTQNFPKN